MGLVGCPARLWVTLMHREPDDLVCRVLESDTHTSN